MADEKKGPRDIRKAPSKPAKEAPAHVRVGEHGIRTTAETEQEVREEAHTEAQAEDFKRSERSTGAGPNPYHLDNLRKTHSKGVEGLEKELEDSAHALEPHRLAMHLESQKESKAADAEVAIPGETRTDSGQKIVLKPARVAAGEKAVLPNIRERHGDIVAEEGEDPERQRQAAAHAEAVREAGKDEMTAEKNTGAIYGGNTEDNTGRGE